MNKTEAIDWEKRWMKLVLKDEVVQPSITVTWTLSLQFFDMLISIFRNNNLTQIFFQLFLSRIKIFHWALKLSRT